MPETAISEERLLKILAENAPPRFPDEGLGPHCRELDEVAGWNRNFAVSVVAGLSTLPQLQVHGVRLDWLQRLVLSKAHVARKIRRRDLAKILNVGLVNARVDRLEDPIEDLFCEFVVSDLGSFRIFISSATSPMARTLRAN